MLSPSSSPTQEPSKIILLSCFVPQVLLTYKGQNLAVLDVESKWQPNKAKETKLCYGTSSLEHPGVQMVAMERGKYYLGGAIRGLELPKRSGGGTGEGLLL